MNIYKVMMRTVIHNIMDIHTVTHDYCWHLVDLKTLINVRFKSSQSGIRDVSENLQIMMEKHLTARHFTHLKKYDYNTHQNVGEKP